MPINPQIDSTIMNAPKDLHYTPKVYLDIFTRKIDGEVKFHRLKEIPILKGGEGFRKLVIRDSNPSKECYCKDIYKAISKRLIEKLEDQYYVEKYSFPYEKSFISEIHKIFTEKNEVLAFKKVKEIILTLLHFKLRNKQVKDLIEESDIPEQSTQSTLKLLKENLNNPHLYAILEKSVIEEVRKPEFKSDIFPEMLNRYSNKDSIFSHFTNYMLKRRIVVFCTNPKIPFYTSCTPGFFLDKKGYPHFSKIDESTGFIFPISPTRLLTIIFGHKDNISTSHKKLITYQRANPNLVKMTNLYTWHSCIEKKVFSSDKKSLEKFKKILELEYYIKNRT